MGKEIITQVQETQRVPNRINPRWNTPRHILIKLTKIKHKEQILKAAREKQQITHKGIPIRITGDRSIETLQVRREWQDILKLMKENNLQPRLLYPARIIQIWRSIKSYQISSVAQSCPNFCNPMNRSTPGLPVHHQHPEFTQTHVHLVSDAIQPSHPLSSPSSPAPNPSQYQSLFRWVNSSHEVAKVLEFQL